LGLGKQGVELLDFPPVGLLLLVELAPALSQLLAKKGDQLL